MLILVTRPEPQASQWAQALGDLGETAVALPLIDISAPAHPEAVSAAWQDLARIRLVMFVSPNAAAWFARLRPLDALWPDTTLAAAPGPGTAETMRQALTPSGLKMDQIISPDADSAQFDSEHLWPLLAPRDWQGAQVLVISGGDQSEARGRAWLSQQLQDRGAQVTPLLTYQRQSAQWTPAQSAQARQAYEQPQAHLWLFSSSEALEHLLQSLGPPPPSAQALTTHPRVADKAREAGFATVLTTRPTPDAVVQARRSMASATP